MVVNNEVRKEIKKKINNKQTKPKKKKNSKEDHLSVSYLYKELTMFCSEKDTEKKGRGYVELY